MLDDRYRIERKVGEGGMSFVYLAHDTETNDRVAIKILSPALAADRNSLKRLRREASLAGRLAHPNICHIIRLGETDAGMVYVVMPFVEGELLCDRTHRLGHIPLADVVPFVRDIAAGLQVAHHARVGLVRDAARQCTGAKSVAPLRAINGRTSIPGSAMSTIKQEMPLCLGASGSVRTYS